MPDHLRVLIAEDLPRTAEILSRFLEDLRTAFPRLEIRSVENLSEVMEIIRSDPPDLLTLDLRLKDATAEQTLSYLEEIDEACAVVLVTGQNLEKYDEKLRKMRVSIIKKGQSWMADHSLLKACAAAVVRRAELQPMLQRDSKMQERIRKMRELTALLFSPQTQDAQRTA